jgi:hypothetical protein
LATGAGHAVIDITGVPTAPTVDTEIAQHLLKTVSAAPCSARGRTASCALRCSRSRAADSWSRNT